MVTEAAMLLRGGTGGGGPVGGGGHNFFCCCPFLLGVMKVVFDADSLLAAAVWLLILAGVAVPKCVVVGDANWVMTRPGAADNLSTPPAECGWCVTVRALVPPAAIAITAAGILRERYDGGMGFLMD